MTNLEIFKVPNVGDRIDWATKDKLGAGKTGEKYCYWAGLNIVTCSECLDEEKTYYIVESVEDLSDDLEVQKGVAQYGLPNIKEEKLKEKEMFKPAKLKTPSGEYVLSMKFKWYDAGAEFYVGGSVMGGDTGENIVGAVASTTRFNVEEGDTFFAACERARGDLIGDATMKIKKYESPIEIS